MALRGKSPAVTPGQLRKLAEEEDARGLELVRAGDRKKAAVAFRMAEHLRATAVELEHGGPPAALTRGPQRAKVNSDPMTSAQRAAISATMSDNTPAMEAARKAGLPSIRAVADALDVDPTFLSRVLSGRKKMPPARAAKFEKLTGYPATRWKA